MAFTISTATDMGQLFEALYDLAIAEGWVNLGSAAPLEGSPLIGDSHRYWRYMNVALHGDTEVNVAELEFRATVGGADLTGSGTPLAINNISTAFQAFDGVHSTDWTSPANGINFPTWIGYDFGSPVVVREIAYRIGDLTSDLDNAPADFRIQWSDDELAWFTEWEVNGEPVWTVSEEREFANPTAVSTPYPFLSTDRLHFNLQGPGVDATQRVYLHFAVDHDRVQDDHWFEMWGFTDYNSAHEVDPASQVGGYVDPMYMSGWNASQDYWFYVNDRRLIAVVQMNTVYTGLYAGFFLPWALPSQYDFPLIIIGDGNRSFDNADTPSDRRLFYDPGDEAGVLRNWEGDWFYCHNHDGGSSAHDPKARPANFMWPYGCGGSSSTGPVSNWSGDRDGHTDNHNMTMFDSTAQDELAIWPVCVGAGTMFLGLGIIGALDGVWAPIGNNITPEQLFSVGGRDFRIVQNLNRVQANAYGAIEEI